MNALPPSLSDVRKIYFIAEDATGPFRRVVQLLLMNGRLISFEEPKDWDRLIQWLYDFDILLARRIESLLEEKEERNFEVLVFSRDQD
jgi:hypothetical protein